MGGYLQVASDEPDLIPAADDAGVLVHGDRVGVAAELTGHAHNLPQQADLVTDRLLRGRPKEGPDHQSESSTSQTHIKGRQTPTFFSPGDDPDWLSVDDVDVRVRGPGGVALELGGQEERRLNILLEGVAAVHHVDVTDHRNRHAQVAACTPATPQSDTRHS